MQYPVSLLFVTKIPRHKSLICASKASPNFGEYAIIAHVRNGLLVDSASKRLLSTYTNLLYVACRKGIWKQNTPVTDHIRGNHVSPPDKHIGIFGTRDHHMLTSMRCRIKCIL